MSSCADPAAGVLCLDVGDRNDNMLSLKLNFRADLRTGKVVQRTTFIGDDCKEGAGREQKARSRAGRGRRSSRGLSVSSRRSASAPGRHRGRRAVGTLRPAPCNSLPHVSTSR